MPEDLASDEKPKAVRFAIDKRAVCVWEHDPIRRNLEFLERVDPGYFQYVAKVHAENLKGEDKQAAALSLRTAYSHACEALLAFLAASIQAPYCIYGWLAQYKNRELASVIRKICNRQPLLSQIMLEPITWDGLSEVMHEHLALEDQEKVTSIRSGYARAWSGFARDFLNDTARVEYNSIKHGFRAAAGGFSITIGQQRDAFTPCPPAQMKGLGGSEFGSAFFVTQPMFGTVNNVRSRRTARNWDPGGFISGLILISMSLANVVGRLRVYCGEAAEQVKITWPSPLQAFDHPWQSRPSVFETNMDILIQEEGLSPLSEAQILEVYKKK